MQRVKIKNCCNLIDYRGKTPEKSDSGYILITAKNVKDDGFSFEPREYIPKENYAAVMVRGIPESGDVLFTTEAPLGNVCRIPQMKEPFAVGQRIVVIRPKDDNLRKDFLEHVLKSQRFREDMWRRSSGSTVKGIRTKELIEIEIPIPDEKKQKIIAESLNKISTIINARQQQLEELDNLIKSRFVEMFGTLTDNTNGFDIVSIENVCSLIKDGTHQTPEYTEDNVNGFQFLSSKDVMSQKIDWTNIKYIPAVLHDKLYATIKPQRNDVLMSKNGVNYGVAAVNDTDEVFDIYVSLALLRPTEVINPVYFRCVINNPDTKRQFDGSIKGIGVPNLHLGEIKKTRILLPPLELQKSFVQFVHQVDKLNVKVQRSLDETLELFNSLMQKYFK